MRTPQTNAIRNEFDLFFEWISSPFACCSSCLLSSPCTVQLSLLKCHRGAGMGQIHSPRASLLLLFCVCPKKGSKEFFSDSSCDRVHQLLLLLLEVSVRDVRGHGDHSFDFSDFSDSFRFRSSTTFSSRGRASPKIALLRVVSASVPTGVGLDRGCSFSLGRFGSSSDI